MRIDYADVQQRRRLFVIPTRIGGAAPSPCGAAAPSTLRLPLPHPLLASSLLPLSPQFRACSHVNHFLSRHANSGHSLAVVGASPLHLVVPRSRITAIEGLGTEAAMQCRLRNQVIHIHITSLLHSSFSHATQRHADDRRTAASRRRTPRAIHLLCPRDSAFLTVRSPLVLSCCFLSLQNAHRCCLPSCSVGRK